MSVLLETQRPLIAQSGPFAQSVRPLRAKSGHCFSQYLLINAVELINKKPVVCERYINCKPVLGTQLCRLIIFTIFLITYYSLSFLVITIR